VGGGTTLETLKHATRISLTRGEAEDEGATPLHAWMEQRLGRRVQGGDVVRERGIRILARKARRGMLLEALVGPIGGYRHETSSSGSD
jgi:hypothetical protein